MTKVWGNKKDYAQRLLVLIATVGDGQRLEGSQALEGGDDRWMEGGLELEFKVLKLRALGEECGDCV